MNNVTFSFSSLTYASKAKKIFTRANIQSKLIKLSGENGCTHGLLVFEKDYYDAILLLRELDIGYRIIRDGYGLF